MHACIAKCAPCKLLQPFIAYMLPLGNQQQTIHQRLPHPHTSAGGAGHAPHCTSTLLCPHLSIHAWQAGMVRRWTVKSPERAPSNPGPNKGIHKSMLMKFVSIEAVPGA
eukprot:1160259-Pelagomonas_calceolata.AAC.2